MKRVLIITYYWPPSGGGGVMRWLKMSKYLPDWGWQPVIYTPENPDPSVLDRSLTEEIHPATEVLTQPIWEPYRLFRKLSGKSKNSSFKAGYISEASRGGWKEQLAVFIRGNFLIPDPRLFWIKPSVAFLSGYLSKNRIDLIVSTGPPHSMHIIGLRLKKLFPDIPWLADFRDPWTEIDFYHRLKLTPLADALHRRLEKKVLQKADVVTTVSPFLQKSTARIAGRPVEVIYNGFDPADFEEERPPSPEKFIIAHFGSFNRDRNPEVLWQVLSGLCDEDEGFAAHLQIMLIGQVDETVINSIRHWKLEKKLKLAGHLDHRSGLSLLQTARVLLLPLNDTPTVKGILPGKMYEYMALKRPILAIGPEDGDYTSILTETNTGAVCDANNPQSIRKYLMKMYAGFKSGYIKSAPVDLEKFSRRQLAKQIIDLPFSSEADA